MTTNFSAHRESAGMQNRIYRSFAPYYFSIEKREQQVVGFRELYKLLRSTDLSEARVGISQNIRSEMSNGNANFKTPRTFIAHPYVEEINKKILEELRMVFSDEKDMAALRELVELGYYPKDYVNNLFSNPKHLLESWCRRQTLGAARYLSEIYGLDENHAKLVCSLAALKETESYFSLDSYRCRYVSNKGTPMMMDMFYFDRPFRTYESIDEIVNVPTEGYIRFNPHHFSLDVSLKKLRKIREGLEIHLTSNLSPLPEQEYLGSSYVKNEKEKISKREAIDLLLAGFNPVEISEVYAGFSEHQLRAFKAHITMGTYGGEQELKV